MSKFTIDDLEPLSQKTSRTRIPPGQHKAKKWSILHVEPVPNFDGINWPVSVSGLIKNEITWSWEEFLQLSKINIKADLHCVTSWSLLDQNFAGVSFKAIIDIVKPKPEAKYVTFEAKSGYTSALPLSEGYLLESDVLLAYEHEGKSLDPKHGGPLRSLVPQLYLWKSVKWLTKITFRQEWERGFWELRNYHIRGDPWLEERYSSQERTRRKDHLIK